MPTLRWMASVEENRPVQGAAGGRADSWVSYLATWWVDLRPGGSREFVAAKQTQTELSHELIGRWFPGAKTSMRVRIGDRYFYVHGIMNGLANRGDTTERNLWLTLMCSERA